MQRRPVLAMAAAALALATAARARTPTRDGPLRVGCDSGIADSGLAGRLCAAFMADIGLAVELRPAPALATLDAVRDGEIDVALANVPAAEEGLAQQSLVYDRKAIALGEYVIVGPLAAPRGRNAALPLGSDCARGLALVRDLAAANPQQPLFVSAADGSGANVVEQALWRAAGVAPAAPWYVNASSPRAFFAEARARRAFALVERGAWLASGGGVLGIACAGDASLAEPIHAMRSFRASHQAGRIFIDWIAGHRGRAIVARQAGYRPPTA